MHVILIGADFEENLGIGILASCLEAAGHRASILPFNVATDAPSLVARVMGEAPEMVGLSIQFQHRAHEFLSFARSLRAAGYRGHITAGAQFPTLAFGEVLERGHGVTSVVLHDGEHTLVELCAAIERGLPIESVAGLALLGADGVAFRTEHRRMPDDLDSIPFARRYRPHNRHMGVPFVPIVAGRGCWSKCSYCSIVAFYRDGREHGGGRLFRLRSPENVAAEMALLWHRAKGPCIFCFHDDNFTLPSAERTLERVRAIRASLDEYGVGKIGIVGKARPDTITPELAHELAELGVIRLYVGVENASEAGGEHLRRGTQQRQIRQALKSCREAGIFNCYNLLVFEPGSTIDHVRENAEFIRDHAEHPVNFCRAEPYYGTPLHLEMERAQSLGGSYLGWNYRIQDDRTETLFRMCSAAFRERNFAPRGVANRYMGLGYAGNVLKRFHGGSRAISLRERARELTRDISLDTHTHLMRAIGFVESAALSDRELVERFTVRLALDVSAADQRWHMKLDALYDDMNAFASEPREPEALRPSRKLLKLATRVALGASIVAVTTANAACSGEMVSDPVPGDAGRADAGTLPDANGIDAGVTTPHDAGPDSGFVVDPVPEDAARPLDAGVDGGHDAGGFVVDPAPEDAGVASLPEAEDDSAYAENGTFKRRLRLVDQWRDSSPQATVRTNDLPLSDPPAPTLVAVRRDELVAVRVSGVAVPFNTRWECDGDVHGDGPSVEWTPASSDDQLRVAVRTRGGVAVVTLRANSVARS